MSTIFANRIAETTNFDGKKIIAEVIGAVLLEQGGVKPSEAVPAQYSYKKKKIYLYEVDLPLCMKRGILAHELGHAHHHWYQENRWCWEGWCKAWERLVEQGVLDGYAAKKPQEGWAEIYRLSLGCYFDPKVGGTKGGWQYDPAKVSRALQEWRAWL